MVAMQGWAKTNEAIARRLLALRGTDEVLDCLAWALEESCIQLPISDPGEDFDAVDPFTFIAAWSRPMPDARRTRLMGLVCEALELDTLAPTDFSGYPLVQDWQARMFSRTERNLGREIDALWSLLEKALVYVDVNRSNDGVSAGSASADFLAAYDNLAKVRCPAKKLVPTLLAWIAPDVFDYRGEAPAKGVDYLALLGKRGVSDTSNEPRPARLDPAKTERLLNAFAAEMTSRPTPANALAAAAFQKAWDPAAANFPAMIERALSQSGTLLFEGYQFNPLREVLAFAKAEPQALAEAFEQLYNEGRQAEERIVPFMRTACAMFERNRGAIVSAMARRSAHESFRTTAAYLYLRFPETFQPFDPNKLRVLDTLCGYKCHFRLTKPECITQYNALCQELLDMLAARPDFEELLSRHGLLGVEGLSRKACKYSLVDELAIFALAHEQELKV